MTNRMPNHNCCFVLPGAVVIFLHFILFCSAFFRCLSVPVRRSFSAVSPCTAPICVRPESDNKLLVRERLSRRLNFSFFSLFNFLLFFFFFLICRLRKGTYAPSCCYGDRNVTKFINDYQLKTRVIIDPSEKKC